MRINCKHVLTLLHMRLDCRPSETAFSNLRVAAANFSVISGEIAASSPWEVPINISRLSGISNERLILSIVDSRGSRLFLSSNEIYDADSPARAANAGIESFFCCRQNLIA